MCNKVSLYLFIQFVLIIKQVCNINYYTNEWVAFINEPYDEATKIGRLYGFSLTREVLPNHYLFIHVRMKKRSLLNNDYHHNQLSQHPKVEWLEQQKLKLRSKRDLFTDPLWPNMWYMNEKIVPSMNILDAYKRFLVNGDGVVVTILDDGIEKNHTDLHSNYDPLASYDFNDNDDDPQPRYEFTDFNRHGTRCAGEVAAIANNNKCGVGIAYKAGIGGIRMLDGDVTDALEAQSLSYHIQHIDIFSASWGPTDDGKTLDGPGTLAQKAILMGIQKGRNGSGTIFVWASGNGGRHQDNCNCDGYTNSMYTLSISSATSSNEQPEYLEKCSSTLATTYSSGADHKLQIVTTDLHDGCTETHTGTSASAPIAAGIIALALQINPKLTWRDVQHLVVRSSRKANLISEDWKLNGAGRWVSHSFGFGLMDASKLVELSYTWETLPARRSCHFVAEIINGTVNGDVQSVNKINVSACMDENNEKVNYLEHVQAYITFTASVRGNCGFDLISPAGTKSKLLMKRPLDTSNEGIINWPFTSTHYWGERPDGMWTLVALCSKTYGELKNWTLSMHGTSTDPDKFTDNQRSLKPNEKICEKNEYLLNDACYNKCPLKYFPDWSLVKVTLEMSNVTEILNVSICSLCHESCQQCYGPLNAHCILCPIDKVLNSFHQCVNPSKISGFPATYLYILSIVCIIISSISIIIFVIILKCFRKNYMLIRADNNDYDANEDDSTQLLVDSKS